MNGTTDQDLSDLTDEDLMSRYQNDDNDAFVVLYSRYETKVYGFLRRKLRDEERVNDAFQATFAKLHRSRSQFDASLALAPWLFTIARSVALDELRRGSREAQTFRPLEDEDETRVPPTSQRKAEVIDLSPLPTPQRSAIEMRYYENLSFDEIASRLSTSPANVRQLVSRGLKQLRQWMKGAGNG